MRSTITAPARTPRRPRRLRRATSALVAVAAIAALSACGAPGTQNAESDEELVPREPESPIAVTILDGAGNLVGSQPIFQRFADENPELISDISFETAAAPDVAGKVRAQQLAGEPDTSVVIGGPDVLGAALAQDLAVQVIPEYESDLIDLGEVQDDSRAALQDLSDGYGVLVRYNPSGPILASNPQTVTDVPSTPEELLEWAEANPGRFTYAQPANSGPGRTFMMSLPYLLGDEDPSDPENGWDRTWAYLAELGQYVSSYPSSSTIASEQFGSGQLELTPTIISIDMNNRENGTWAPDTAASIFDDQHWVADGHYYMVPRGASPETLYVAIQMVNYLLDADQQIETFGSGTLTSANQEATVDQASPEAADLIEQFGRPDFYPEAFETGTIETPLEPEALQTAFDIWQREIGSTVGG